MAGLAGPPTTALQYVVRPRYRRLKMTVICVLQHNSTYYTKHIHNDKALWYLLHCLTF